METSNGEKMVLSDLKVNTRLILSGLWGALTLLYIYADYIGLFRPGMLEDVIAGDMWIFSIDQTFLISISVMMSIPCIMVFLSLVLNSRITKWLNIFAGVIFLLIAIAAVIGEDMYFYIYFTVIEVFLLILILVYAWNWPKVAIRGFRN
jgi:hypothetical protein